MSSRRRKTKSKKQIRLEAKDEKASKKFIIISVGITLVLIIMMYLSYNSL